MHSLNFSIPYVCLVIYLLIYLYYLHILSCCPQRGKCKLQIQQGWRRSKRRTGRRKKEGADQMAKHHNTNTHCPTSHFMSRPTIHLRKTHSPPIWPYLPPFKPGEAGKGKLAVFNQTLILSECDCVCVIGCLLTGVMRLSEKLKGLWIDL